MRQIGLQTRICWTGTNSRNSRPTATDEKTRKVFSVLFAISLVGTISGKSLKLLPPDVIFTAKMRQIRFAPLRELTTLPRNPITGIKGPTSSKGKRGGRGGRKGAGGGREE